MAAESAVQSGDGFSYREEEIMDEAIAQSQKSKDPDMKVGAVLVSSNNEILGRGYNCHPKVKEGLDSNDVFPWTKDKNDFTKNKHYYVCHAELNAIVNAKLSGQDMKQVEGQNKDQIKGSSLYVTHQPCFECAKLIVQFELKEVIFLLKKKKKSESMVYEAAEKTFSHSIVVAKSYKEHMEAKYPSDYRQSEKSKESFMKLMADSSVFEQ